MAPYALFIRHHRDEAAAAAAEVHNNGTSYGDTETTTPSVLHAEEEKHTIIPCMLKNKKEDKSMTKISAYMLYHIRLQELPAVNAFSVLAAAVTRPRPHFFLAHLTKYDTLIDCFLLRTLHTRGTLVVQTSVFGQHALTIHRPSSSSHPRITLFGAKTRAHFACLVRNRPARRQVTWMFGARAHTHVTGCVCLCVCLCVWEREKHTQRERERDNQTDRGRDRGRDKIIRIAVPQKNGESSRLIQSWPRDGSFKPN